jgi:2-polyprenyl-6-methoxyphenol hydroxylase-like FAD-dependent oxidoreductase
VAAFVAALKRAGRIPRDYPEQLAGHAYLLHGWSRRPVVAAGALLVGDAAGLAYPQSGEGIRPAVESGLLAGQALVEALRGDTGALERYRERLAARFGPAVPGGPARLGRHLPARLVEGAGRVLLGQPWFARRWVLDRWFLHRGTPAL